MASYKNNTSQGKGWIFDSDSTVHACSQKELFNFLVVKEKEIIKMVDRSTCKVIDTGIVKVTKRDETVRALEAVRYVQEARYNLISIRVFDEKVCQIQVQQGAVTVSQEDRVILKREKCGGLYKLKKGNLVRGGVSRINLEGSSSPGGASNKTVTGHEPGQSVAGRRNGALG